MNVKEANEIYQKGYKERVKNEYSNALAQIRGACQSGRHSTSVQFDHLSNETIKLLEKDGYTINSSLSKDNVYIISGWQGEKDKS